MLFQKLVLPFPIRSTNLSSVLHNNPLQIISKPGFLRLVLIPMIGQATRFAGAVHPCFIGLELTHWQSKPVGIGAVTHSCAILRSILTACGPHRLLWLPLTALSVLSRHWLGCVAGFSNKSLTPHSSYLLFPVFYYKLKGMFSLNLLGNRAIIRTIFSWGVLKVFKTYYQYFDSRWTNPTNWWL